MAHSGVPHHQKLTGGKKRVSDWNYIKAVEENAWFLKRFLVNLELVSGLSINPGKCCIYCINMEDQLLGRCASILGCNVCLFPFKYLGVKVGILHKKPFDWEYVVQKIKNR
ncbi:hypothetical protein ACS0TY_032623 [Phlomoides rotata]